MLKINRRPPDCERPAIIGLSMPPARILVVAGLAVAGALSAATAATVYTATLPMHDAQARTGTHLLASGGGLQFDALEAQARQRERPAADRLTALEYVVAGACLAPREMLFGATDRRWAALDRVAAELRDVPQWQRTYAQARAMLRQFSAGGAIRPIGAPQQIGEHVIQLVLPDILLERVHLCRSIRLP